MDGSDRAGDVVISTVTCLLIGLGDAKEEQVGSVWNDDDIGFTPVFIRFF